MEPFRILSQFFWLVFLGISLFNYFGARRHLEAGPNSAEALRYLNWASLAGALPWAMMGLGQLSGFTPTIWYYFRPQDLNPFVILWLSSIFAGVIAYAVWVLFFDGARKVREFELLAAFGMRSSKPMSETLIKITAAVGPLFFIGWVWIAVTNNVPLPK